MCLHPQSFQDSKKLNFFSNFKNNICMHVYPGLVVHSSKFITTYWNKFSFLHNQFHLIHITLCTDVPVKNILVWLRKMVLAQHFFTGCWSWQKVQQSLTPAVDWLEYGLIGSSGLLLVDGHLLESSRDWWVFYFLLHHSLAGTVSREKLPE
jgi:hypothetical protein